MRRFQDIVPRFRAVTMLTAVLSFSGAAFCVERHELADIFLVEPVKAEAVTPRVSADRSGSINTTENQTLRLTTDMGSVKVIALPKGAAPVVNYSVHIETDAKDALAQKLLDRYVLQAKATNSGVEISGTLPSGALRSAVGAQFWVEYTVYVPPSYSVSVETSAGDIETQDVGGRANLVTLGGNIRAGRVGFAGPHVVATADHPVARLETQGGHIRVLDVAGDTTAFTAGGHINAGNIAGNATLRSGGGHIHAGQISGKAQLETDGGNITVGKAGSFVAVRTGGGQIDFGEVRGSVRAQTGGGGIRIMYVSGPMEVESNSGSICLTRVAGAVRAMTTGGTITAWINPDNSSSGGPVRLPGPSQLASGVGDIIVFLPRNLAATIDASVENGDDHRIEADPALQLITETAHHGTGPVHATAALNGGGDVLKLRTTGGKIRLQFTDSQIALRESLINEQKARLAQHLAETSLEQMDMKNFDDIASLSEPSGNSTDSTKLDWVDSMVDKLQVAFLGGVREDSDEFKKRLVYSPAPCYPELARRAGLQGIVRLQVRLKKDGAIEVQKLLNGDPALADAAIAAVKQWRAKPEWINGQKVEVISMLSFNFQLH